MDAVSTATGISRNIGSYRNKAGLRNNDIKFSHLKGMYNGGVGDTSGYYTLDNTNYSSFLTHFQGYSTTSPLSNYQAEFFLANSSSGSLALPIVYQKNMTTGGFNYGCRYQVGPVMTVYSNNVHLNTIMWRNYTLVMGKFDGTERAIAYGPIEMKSVNADYTTSYADISNILSLNAFIAQDYYSQGVYSVIGSTVPTTFRTTTRTKMVGVWLKTDGTLNHAWFDTTPFTTGASLTATFVSRLHTDLTTGEYFDGYHINNQYTFGTMFQYAGYAECNNPGKNGSVVGYYVFMAYDVGLRNATSGSVLNVNRGFQGKNDTIDVLTLAT